MISFDVEVKVWLKPSVFDPQGNAVEKALRGLGHEGVDNVRIGKYMNLQVEAESQTAAEEKVKQMCETVLCNLVIEIYDFSLHESTGGDAQSSAAVAQEQRS